MNDKNGMETMSAYTALDLQYIGGQWRAGTSTRHIKNINPFSQAEIFELQAASSVDVDSAYSAAEAAFKSEMTKSIEVRQQVIN